MGLNLKLRDALIEKFGTQIDAATQLGIRESRISYLVNRHVTPTDRERQALERAFGKAIARRLLELSAK